jgi:cytoskeleton protein RodZ
MNENRIHPVMPGLEAHGARTKPDGNVNPAGEAGWFLMREREDRSLSIEQISEIVGIHPYHIEAIELGNMANMPSRAEALEMIAAYADYLGFEPEPLLQHYVSFLPAPQMAPRRHPANPAPMSSAKILPFGKFVKLPPINIKLPTMPKFPTMPSGNGGIVASVAVAFFAFSALTYMLVPDSAETVATEQVAVAPEAVDPMPTASTGSDSAEVKVSEQPMDADTVATVEPSLEKPPVIAQPPVLEDDVLGAFIKDNVAGGDAEAPKQIAAAETQGRVYGSPDEKVRLVLRANRDIWLLIEDGKGSRVATQLLNKGDVFRVPNKPGLVATVQDGGAITFIVDGEEKGLLGQPGAVLAAEPLDIRKLQDRG